jgi:hypothetical protein
MLTSDAWFNVILGGELSKAGMVSFAGEISRKHAADIRAYVIARANQNKPGN